jgi:RIO-like serine/threonine protein kinase
MKKFAYQLYACGKKELPRNITVHDRNYQLEKILKHDFFAATALYHLMTIAQAEQHKVPNKLVLKLSRQEHFLGLPLHWLGKILCDHEISILNRLSRLNCVPHLLSRYGPTGFIYEYIEGSTLDNVASVPDDFFDKFVDVLRQIHKADVAYVDMNKRSNVIVTPDGSPKIIDFQISLCIDNSAIVSPRASFLFRRFLQRADIYHLLKHKRKLCRHLLTPTELTLSRCSNSMARSPRLLENSAAHSYRTSAPPASSPTKYLL